MPETLEIKHATREATPDELAIANIIGNGVCFCTRKIDGKVTGPKEVYLADWAAKEMRGFLSRFYSELRPCDEHAKAAGAIIGEGMTVIAQFDGAWIIRDPGAYQPIRFGEPR